MQSGQKLTFQEKNDILMALSGATTGKIAVAKDKDVFVIDIILIRAKTRFKNVLNPVIAFVILSKLDPIEFN
jgi:hypothetical protein